MRRVFAFALLAALPALAWAATLVATGSAAGKKDPPTITPIHANFDPDAKATFYNIFLTYPSSAINTSQPTYAWHLDPPPDDPGCNHFQPSASDPSRAVWFHSEDDGCSHKTTQHNGTVSVKITVTLSNDARAWTCFAEYKGTITGDGPTPQPCTIEAGALVAVKRPAVSQKEQWAILADLFDACAETEGAIAAAAAVAALPTAGVSAVPGAVAGGAAALCVVAARIAKNKQADPPDRHFRAIARAKVVPILRLRAGHGIPAAVASAANALALNQGRSLGLTQAFVTAINRASGAHDAGDAAAQTAQEHAAAADALALAKLDDARPALRVRLRNAVAAAGVHLSLTPRAFLVAQRQVAKHGLPKAVAGTLAREGVSRSIITELRGLIAAAKPLKAAVSFPAAIASPALIAADRKDAATMREYAAFAQG